MWLRLRDRQLLNKKFRRQYPIRDYVIDFYCDEASLAIELDGGQHLESDAVIKDQERTEILNRCGITVLRYSNLDVLQNIDGVLSDIAETILRLLASERGTPSP